MAGYGLKAFLIAQSLNQIEKAYGPNNSILDNCHVRVVFSTNDERTAKRVSDALGTATELRAQRNYAGHRLSPWLGHLMVSRQETARALLTPGEVMQLPPDDEIVMVSGHPPVRAKKLRYYEDLNFTSRVRPPPALSAEGFSDRPPLRPDDWTGLVPPSLPPSLVSVSVNESFGDDGGGLRVKRKHHEIGEVMQAIDPGALSDEGFESGLANDAADVDRQFQRIARQAALDPGDGIPL
jgi:type IV secretion system protein VirD4